MEPYVRQSKAAWEYNAYDFWVREAGAPTDRASAILANPLGALKRHAVYFDRISGTKITNICGSCGKKAVPLLTQAQSQGHVEAAEGSAKERNRRVDP